MNIYEEKQPDCVVDVLGTTYRIFLDIPKERDKLFETCDGYCDKTSKRIAISDFADTNLDDPAEYRKYCIRHELIHAFLFESGIGGCTLWDVEGEEHPEHMVEWMGLQFPKLLKAFQTVDAL